VYGINKLKSGQGPTKGCRAIIIIIIIIIIRFNVAKCTINEILRKQIHLIGEFCLQDYNAL
jgi:hypothetical protein